MSSSEEGAELRRRSGGRCYAVRKGGAGGVGKGGFKMVELRATEMDRATCGAGRRS